MVPMRRVLQLLCLALSLFSILPAYAAFQSFIVTAGQNKPLLFESTNGSSILEAGTTVDGWVRASGGSANDIRFYVTDPGNVTVVLFGNITYTEFSFIASTAGAYTAHFDNSGSRYSKSITFDYSLTPPILGIPQSLFYTILIVISIMVVIIGVAFIVLRRRRREPKLKPTETAAQKTS